MAGERCKCAQLSVRIAKRVLSCDVISRRGFWMLGCIATRRVSFEYSVVDVLRHTATPAGSLLHCVELSLFR